MVHVGFQALRLSPKLYDKHENIRQPPFLAVPSYSLPSRLRDSLRPTL